MAGFADFDEMFANEGLGETVTPVKEAVQTPTQTAQAQPVVSQAPVVQQKASVATISDDFEIDLPPELQQTLGDMGVVVGDIGTKVSKVPIERYKASSAKIDRISFLTKKVMAVKFHYLQDVGSIICFGGKCCEIGGTPQVRYLFPIAVYTTDSEGTISGKKVELKVLSAGDDLYKSIMTVNTGAKAQGGIDHVDLLVTCTDDKYQKISLTYAGEAVWRKYPQIVEFLSNRWKKDGANAYMAVARKCDEASLMKLIGIDDQAQSNVPETYDPNQNADLSKFFED